MSCMGRVMIVTFFLWFPLQAALGAPPKVQFQSSSSSGIEATSPANLTVILSAITSNTVKVQYAVTGSATGGGVDYTLANGTLTIPANTLSANISIPINNDNLV